jgi:DNA-binding response OmpR family regulator
MKAGKSFNFYVVEDDPKYGESLKQHSLENNFRDSDVQTFPTGESCIEVLETSKVKPEAIVLDYVLNGKWKRCYEWIIIVLDRIKHMGGKIPVIILSGPNDTEVAIETLHSGACD